MNTNFSKNIGTLYHLTTLENWKKIQKDNILKASVPLYNTGKKSVSLSRNKRSNIVAEEYGNPYSVLIELDGKKLSEKYKIIPYKVSDKDFSEERILSDITNLDKYIIDIKYYISSNNLKRKTIRKSYPAWFTDEDIERDKQKGLDENKIKELSKISNVWYIYDNDKQINTDKKITIKQLTDKINMNYNKQLENFSARLNNINFARLTNAEKTKIVTDFLKKYDIVYGKNSKDLLKELSSKPRKNAEEIVKLNKKIDNAKKYLDKNKEDFATYANQIIDKFDETTKTKLEKILKKYGLDANKNTENKAEKKVNLSGIERLGGDKEPFEQLFKKWGKGVQTNADIKSRPEMRGNVLYGGTCFKVLDQFDGATWKAFGWKNGDDVNISTFKNVIDTYLSKLLNPKLVTTMDIKAAEGSNLHSFLISLGKSNYAKKLSKECKSLI